MDSIVLFSLLFIFYTYAGYPLLLWILGKMKRKINKYPEIFPTATVIIAAYNEENCLGKTIESILSSIYPAHLFDILIVSDASTDRTDEIASSFGHRVRLLRMPARSGKTRALDTAIKNTAGEIFIFADASSIFFPETISNLIENFANPKVGSTVGSKMIISSGTSVARGDGAYWRYESNLRRLENITGASWVGCEGGIFAIRKELFSIDFSDDVAEDYSLCCRIYEKGYLNIYEANARVYEIASKDMVSEFYRKKRVIIRGIRAFFAFGYLLNPFKHSEYVFQNVSHRFFRWTVPFFLIFMFLCSGLSHNLYIQKLFYCQFVFYSLALIGMIIQGSKAASMFIFSIPTYFTVVNFAAFAAWMTINKKYGIWAPTKRENCNISQRGI